MGNKHDIRAPNVPPTIIRKESSDQKTLIYHGERGGTRTLDPMIKSHDLNKGLWMGGRAVRICHPAA